MDREPEELQFMGFYGIYRESYKIIVSCRKIFSQIMFSLILPLSFIFLAQIEVSDLLFDKIVHNEHKLENTRSGSLRYTRIRDRISSEVAYYWIFKAIYFIFLLVLSLLSTSAVVYTIACIYTSKDISFKKVISVVPIVWKRLIVTFLWNFFIMFVYNFVASLIIILLIVTVEDSGHELIFITLFVPLIIAYFVGFIYINILWHLANVISVLEDSYGLQAWKKSKELIKGKMLIACGIFVKLQILLFGVNFTFENLVAHGESFGMVGKLIFGIVCFLLLSILIHYALVIQTVIYFVCKSYHHQNIDKSCLAEHLEEYFLGDYVPLIKDKDVQLHEFDV